MRFGLLILFLLAFGLSALSLRAHNAPGSSVELDFHRDRVTAELRLPLSELEIAFGEPLLNLSDQVVSRHKEALEKYLLQHLQVRSPDQQPWVVNVKAMRVLSSETPIDLQVWMELHPPGAASPRRLHLFYDVISHEVMNHVILVSVRSDWDHGKLGNDPEMVGTLRSFSRELSLDRTDGSAWQGFLSSVKLGMQHIAEGTDHLLFLLVLLLPAPLFASSGAWIAPRPLAASLWHLAKLVSAFTLGHSLTLALGALGVFGSLAKAIELLIAVSIFTSAVHAWRPLFPGREPLVAGLFGLVHGLAFAEVLSRFHLDTWHLLEALVGFNLGIELMQFAVVLIVVPWLFLLSRTASYGRIRCVFALSGAVASTGWFIERLQSRSNFVTGAIECAADHWPWLLASIVALALLLGRETLLEAFRLRRKAT